MMNNPYIRPLQAAIEPYRQQIIQHPVYSAMTAPEDLRTFMEHHVYAVWDFMSLLKSLQNNLTCTRVPWFPVGSAGTRYLINEIVVGEESDLDQHGNRKSHFELYLDAMRQAGADVEAVETFVQVLQNSGDLQKAYTAAGTPGGAQDFVNFTFDIIHAGEAYLQAAIFTFGREDLIPNMFLSMINDMDKSRPGHLSVFRYYLERHIEVDGDHHSHLALEMTAELCGMDETRWQKAQEATIRSLQQRIVLWDAVHAAILAKKGVEAAGVSGS